jgi:predicted MPP superfamily phosphohydrolase
MTKIAWCSDIHLDFINSDPTRLLEFGQSLIVDQPDSIMITGDVSLANTLIFHLSSLESVVKRPIFFVLGNHDFYNGTFDVVRKDMKDISNMSQYLRYLPNTPYVVLSPATALVGHDGWYDAGYGNVIDSRFIMADWIKIGDYVNERVFAADSITQDGNVVKAPDYAKIVNLSKKLAHVGVTHVANGIKAAIRYHKVILVATHFPPFAEAHLFEGRVGSDVSQPWYTSRMMGDMLRQAANAYPKVRFEVFTGHTHSKCDLQISHNLFVHVAGAEYGQPQLQSIINVP